MVALLKRLDVLVTLPTGFEKSLIFQIPAMLREGPTIVISPLLALMADRERALKNRDIPVVMLHSRLRTAERRAALEKLESGGRLVVLTTPETLGCRRPMRSAAVSRELRSLPAQHQNSAEGVEGRIAFVRAKLLPPVPTGRATRRADRYLDQPRRLSLHRSQRERVM